MDILNFLVSDPMTLPTDAMRPYDIPKYNCGLVEFGGKRYLSYRFGLHMQSGTGIAVVDESFRGQSSVIVSTLESRKEDLRLFVHQGRLCGSFTHTQGPVRVRICRFAADLSVEKEIDFQFTPTRYEKNWQFFEHEGRLLCIYTVSPHVIYECDWDGRFTLLHSTPFANTWERNGVQLRGGTPPVLHDGRYYSAFHTSNYYMGMYCFAARPPFEVLGISANPFVDHSVRDIQFPCGLIRTPGGFIVAYGEADRLARALTLQFRT
jgi:hypothetical protein